PQQKQQRQQLRRVQPRAQRLVLHLVQPPARQPAQRHAVAKRLVQASVVKRVAAAATREAEGHHLQLEPKNKNIQHQINALRTSHRQPDT
ncbi:hypothetical protein CRM22_009624, partial [Opisthorchis felineus]